MTDAAFWNEENPNEPWGLFDDNARLPISISWATWLANEGTTYESHTITADAVLEVISSEESSGVITIWFKVADDATPVLGIKYPFTVHVVGEDGREDERTFWLKIIPR